MNDGRYTFHANSLGITRAGKAGHELVAHVAPSGSQGIDAIKTLVDDANKGLDSPVNEPWLSALHAICFDLGVPSGHIGQRVGQLADKVRQLVDAQRSGREDAERDADMHANLRGAVARVHAELEPWRTAVLRQCEGIDMTSKDPGDVVDALVDRLKKRGDSNVQSAHETLGDALDARGLPTDGDYAKCLQRLLGHAEAATESAFIGAMTHYLGVHWYPEGTPPAKVVAIFREKVLAKEPNPWRDAVQALLHRLGSSPAVPMFHDPQQATKMLADELQRVMLGRAQEHVKRLLGQGFGELYDGIGKAESNSATDKIRRGLRELR